MSILINKKSLSSALALCAAYALTGCQTVPYQGQARDVKRRPKVEGIVAVPLDPRPEDRQRADERMKSNCSPLAVNILEEGEIVVGQETHTSGKETDRASSKTKVGSLFGIPVISGEEGGKDTSSSTLTKSVKEWQISYKCEEERRKKTR